MLTVLSITIPFFAIIFLGSFFKSQNFFDNESSKILTRFALFVTLPPFIFLNIIKSSESIYFSLQFIIRFEIVTLFILTVCFIFSRFYLKINKKNSSILSLNAAYPNYGYIGIPLCILAFGENASIPISIILLTDSIILLTFTSIFAEETKKKNIFFNFIQIIYKILKNPILVSVLIGFLFILFDLKIHTIIYNFLSILSLAAPPAALFSMGIILWNKFDKDFIKPVFFITIMKLIIHPLFISIIFIIFPSSVPTLWIKVAILCSSLPVAANVFAMAGFYNTFIRETSNSIMITTILSTFSVPFVLFLLLNH